MLLSTTDEAVVAAAKTPAEDLNEVESASTDEAFTSTLVECTEESIKTIGVDYSDACEAGSDCC